MSEFHHKHKHHIRLWITLVVITAISGYFAFFYQAKNTAPSRVEQATTAVTTSSTATEVNQKPTLSPAKTITKTIEPLETKPAQFVYTSVDNYSEIPTTTPETQSVQNSVFITFTAGDKTYTTNVPEHSTAYAVMQQLAKTTAFTFSGKSYGDLGFFVQEINGLRNDDAARMYWFYYVNGQRGTVGVSNYAVKPNDKIEWKYEKSDD
jgi:hypothetical protein